MDYRSKIDLKEIEFRTVNWIHLAQDRVIRRVHENTAMGFLVPQKAGNSLTS
jgi:hypothetical protein